jgi:type VI secretion system protein ImpH
MAHEDRPASDDLSWLERLAREPGSFDFHVVLRRLEAAFPDQPRLGEAVRPADEPLRLGQVPSTSFEPSAIAAFAPRGDQAPSRLSVNFLGVWGPQGPLPLHLTEYARDRIRHAGDRTLASFLDVFHHRMLLLFHRAWAKARPTAALDRPEADAFAAYVGAFVGLALPATRKRGPFPDRAKLYYAGRFAPTARSAEGLRDVVADYFGAPAAIEEFVGDWMDLPVDARWQLGVSPETGRLGRTSVLGARVWSRGHKFRLVLGPLSRAEFERTLPNSETVSVLSALVRLYTNDEWDWDLRLILAPDATEGMQLGRGARLGWTTRLGRAAGVREDLIVNPALGRTRRVQEALSPI